MMPAPSPFNRGSMDRQHRALVDRTVGRLSCAAAALAVLITNPTPAFAYCRASIDTSPIGPCVEEPGVPLLRWMRGCIEYAFHPRVFERLTELSESEVRADFEAAFSTWAEVDCGRPAFEVRQGEDPART